MTYLCCEECGFRAVRRPLSVAGFCPRCRLRGRFVPFTETERETRSTSALDPDSPRDGGLVAESSTGYA